MHVFMPFLLLMSTDLIHDLSLLRPRALKPHGLHIFMYIWDSKHESILIE